LTDKTTLGIAARTVECDDLEWAKPYVDEARTSVARGDILTGAEFFKRLNARLEALRLE